MSLSQHNPSSIQADQVVIRAGVQADLRAITDIYNRAAIPTTATLDTEPRTPESKRGWFQRHGDEYPLLVAESGDTIIGWAALSEWADRCSYRTTCEVSIYLEKAARGEGLGSRLMEALLEAGRQADLHVAIARIVEGNPASVRLHEKAGFITVGRMREVGYKFGRYLDVIVMEKLLDGSRK